MKKVWQSSYPFVCDLFDRAAHCEKRVLCQTPGGRKQVALIYGGENAARIIPPPAERMTRRNIMKSTESPLLC